MGQYWHVVNLDKKECIHAHALGCGLKLWEQLANHPGTGAALIILCAALPETRGGGDFDLVENWHGPERKFPAHATKPGPMPEDYAAVAARTIGRWAGDRIALVGDYAKDSDLPKKYEASKIYGRCKNDRYPDEHDITDPKKVYRDISADVARVIEHELGGKYEGDGWRQWKKEGAA